MRVKGLFFASLLAKALLATQAVIAQEQTAQPTPTYSSGRVSLWLGIEAGVQIVGERDAYWNLSSTFSGGVPFALSRHWYEAYVKPSARFNIALTSNLSVYGGLAAIGTYSLRKDVFLTGDTGRFLFEQAYAGVKLTSADKWLTFDLSAGQQEYRIGSGMLIATGAGNGFERGAVIFGPRRAWAMTGIARASMGPLSVDAFVLDANELQSNDTGTRLAGAKIEYALGKDQFAGLSYIKVTHSTAPYIQAPPGGFWIGLDAAVQRNDRINLAAWGGRFEIGNTFVTLPWLPTLSYAYQTFSGDNPNTPKLERFDPLFYDGSPPAWVTGSNGSLVFINTNINAHKLSLRVMPTQQDIVTLRYTHIRANELNSPLQFGQATRLVGIGGTPILVSGVRNHHLSDDFLLEYTRVVTPNIYASFGLAASYPGAGLRQLLNGATKDWYGGFANLVVRY